MLPRSRLGICILAVYAIFVPKLAEFDTPETLLVSVSVDGRFPHGWASCHLRADQ
jgi:hypothetical protein